MKTVHFLRFFTLKEDNFYLFLSSLDIMWFTVDIILGYKSMELFRNQVVTTSLLFIDFVMLALTIFCVLYFFIMKKYQWVIHKFYCWTRFLAYFGFIFFFIGYLIFSIYNSNYEDEFSLKIFYIVFFGLSLPFCFFNAYWCIALHKIITDSIENNDAKTSKISSLYTSETSGKEV